MRLPRDRGERRVAGRIKGGGGGPWESGRAEDAQEYAGKWPGPLRDA